VEDFLAIPAAHISDDMTRNPELWIENTLARLEAPQNAAA